MKYGWIKYVNVSVKIINAKRIKAGVLGNVFVKMEVFKK